MKFKRKYSFYGNSRFFFRKMKTSVKKTMSGRGDIKKAVENQRLLKWLGNLEVNFLDSPFKKTRISAIFSFQLSQNIKIY